MPDTPKKTSDPFAVLDSTPAPTRRKRVAPDAIAEAGEGLGFTAPPKKDAAKPTPTPKPAAKKPKPKTAAPQINRLRKAAASPTAQFNVRVSPDTANGFYDYARANNLKMGEVLTRAYKALAESEDKEG